MLFVLAYVAHGNSHRVDTVTLIAADARNELVDQPVVMADSSNLPTTVEVPNVEHSIDGSRVRSAIAEDQEPATVERDEPQPQTTEPVQSEILKPDSKR